MPTQKKEVKNGDIQFFLRLSVSSKNYQKVQKILSENCDRINASDNLGIDGEEGILFGLALTASPKMLKILIDNYVEMVIERQETDQGRKVKERLLSEMLERQLDESVYEYDELSDEYKELLAPWLPRDEDSESEQDLGGFGDDVYDPMAAEDLSQMSDGGAEDFGQDHSSSPRTPIEYPGDFEDEKHACSGHGYETNKELIESQITDIKLSENAEMAQGGDSGGGTISPDFVSGFAIAGEVEPYPAVELE